MTQITISEADKLLLVNKELQVRLLVSRRETLSSQLEIVGLQLQEATQNHTRLVNQMAQKYGFDPSSVEMDAASGVVLQRGSPRAAEAPAEGKGT